MSLESACPGCGTKVRIPESLLGKRVKCPKCAMIFAAEDPDVGFEEVKEDEEERPRRRRPAPVEDDDQSDDDDYEPRPRRRGKRAAAMAVVKPLAIAFIVLGALGLAYALINVIAVLTGKGIQLGGLNQNQMGAVHVGIAVGASLPFIWGLVVTFAGITMLTMRNYSSVMIGVVFAMLPCSPGCVIGIPFGIWGLIVLLRSDVKRAFSS